MNLFDTSYVPYDPFYLTFLVALLAAIIYLFWGIRQMWLEEQEYTRQIAEHEARRQEQQEWLDRMSVF